MKRAYPEGYKPRYEVIMSLPERLFIVHDSDKGTLLNYIFQPFLTEECSRLVIALRKKDLSPELVAAVCAVLGYPSRASDAQHQMLNQICLIDTRCHRLGSLDPIERENVQTKGAIHVEYLCLKSSKVIPPILKIPSSSSSSSIDTDTSDTSSNEEDEKLAMIDKDYSRLLIQKKVLKEILGKK